MTIKVNSRGFLTPYFMKTTYLYCLPTFIIFWPPLPPNIHCKIPSSTLLFLLPWFFDWMGDHTTSDVLFYLMTLWLYTCRAFATIVLQGPCGVFYATKDQFTNTWHVFLLVLWFDTTYTKKERHTAYTGINRQTRSYKYILTPPVMCSQ